MNAWALGWSFIEIRSLSTEGPLKATMGITTGSYPLFPRIVVIRYRHTYLFDLDIQVTTPIYSNHDIPSCSIAKCIIACVELLYSQPASAQKLTGLCTTAFRRPHGGHSSWALQAMAWYFDVYRPDPVVLWDTWDCKILPIACSTFTFFQIFGVLITNKYKYPS